MMELNDEQLALQAEARKFAIQEILPVAAQYDESAEFPDAILKKAMDLGLMNLAPSAELGGTGLSVFDSCLVVEELSVACVGFSTSMVANDLGFTPILLAGSEEQKQSFVASVITARQYCSFALSEPGAGSDAAGITTSIVRDGDHYIINGAKQWITNAGVASQYTVFATLDKSQRHKSMCCIVVPADTEGVTPGPHENKMGQRCSNTCPIIFDNVRVPVANLIGNEGEGFSIAMRTLDHSRPITAISAVAIARSAFEYARQYAKDRKQFSQSISSFQGIQFMLADMATDIEAARLLTWQSAKMLDAGKSATLQSSMAKRFSADIGMKAACDAVQIYGGNGYTKDYPVEKLMRDAKLMQIYEDTLQKTYLQAQSTSLYRYQPYLAQLRGLKPGYLSYQTS